MANRLSVALVCGLIGCGGSEPAAEEPVQVAPPPRNAPGEPEPESETEPEASSTGLGTLKRREDAPAPVGREVHGHPIRGQVELTSITRKTGTLTADQFAALITRRMSALRRCYHSARRNLEPAGHAELAVTVDGQGAVSQAQALESSAQDPRLTHCVLGVFRRLRLRDTQAPGDTTFVVELRWKPTEPDHR